MQGRFSKLFVRAVRLVCPLCGQGKLFRGWLTMNATCPHCGVKFEREPGFFLGSIYINYGLTALISVIVATPILLYRVANEVWVALACLAFVIVFPLLWFPWARSLWLGFDQWRDPREGEL